MSADEHVGPACLIWADGGLQRCRPGDHEPGESLLAADSWLVDDGRVFGLELHRQRFERGVKAHIGRADAAAFWLAAVDAIPSHGAWFPRVELLAGPVPRLALRLRIAPERRRSAVLATATGADRRTRPTIKGPDLRAMGALRDEVAPLGADEAVICSPQGYVVEGAYSALLWWRGETLCSPSDDLARIPSVTAAGVLTLAAALGVDTVDEAVTPDELDGLEIWALSSLHGIRIVTDWIDGPSPAEQPGRLGLWRERLGRLSRPLATVA